MQHANDNVLADLPRSAPHVVAFSGAAGSGKSTAAQYLAELGYVRVRFAAPLKAMMRAAGLTNREIEGDLKEVPCDKLAGKTPRHAMQTLGTEWGRDMIGQDFWTGLWEDSAHAVLDQGGRVVVEDCRFLNEADAVRRLGGKVYRLFGRGGLGGTHSSEGQEGLLEHAAIFNGGPPSALREAINMDVLGYRNRQFAA